MGFENTVYGIDQNDTATMGILVEIIGNDAQKETLECSIAGLPAGVMYILQKTTIDTTNYPDWKAYTFMYQIYAINPTPGNYQLQMVVKTSSNGTKTYPFQLNVTNLIDCSYDIVGKGGPVPSNPYGFLVDSAGGYSGSLSASFYRSACDTVQLQVLADSVSPANTTYSLNHSCAINCQAQQIIVYPQVAKFNPDMSVQMVRGVGSYTVSPTGHTTIQLVDTFYTNGQYNYSTTFHFQ